MAIAVDICLSKLEYNHPYVGLYGISAPSKHFISLICEEKKVYVVLEIVRWSKCAARVYWIVN